MDMNHLIGQRFNLISKSDIRYVGTLHEINPEASTIALENVMSYGTEGRRGDGTDVPPPTLSTKEEKKEAAQPEPPRVPDDPAILGQNRICPDRVLCLARNKDLLLVFLKALPNHHRVLSNPPPVTPNSLHSKAVLTLLMVSALVPHSFLRGLDLPLTVLLLAGILPPGHGFPQGPGHFPPNMPMGPPGQQLPPQQRPGPPGVPPPAKATSELPVGDKVPSKPATPAAQNAPTPPVESKPSVAEAVQGLTGPTAIPQKNGRVVPAIPMAVPKSAATPAQGNGAITDATAAATAAVAAAMAKLPQPGPPKKPGQGEPTADGLARKMNEMRPFDAPRAPRGGHQHPRGRGGVRHQHKKIEVPESDYDFETANAKFNKQDLVKEAIATGTPAAEAESLASAEVEAFGETASHAATSTSGTTPYNRTNSFFDNISSEARDREENSVNRVGGREWRGEEEKRNIETFGQGSVDGYRGRGRGYGRGRGFGRGRGYGGGRGRGYGGRGGGRPTSQSTGVPSLG
ncbi:Lsm14 N-terminal [Penicillium malachiteum]|uniref:Lsm14 N-terminal n=1 Tax=Penicillium malachiteum TaxID=1324776 RepID=A0AAD6HQ12_9EURO|nr:Lsm14 N-terminal [Penicillium malachiteum]